ncbi:MAG: nitroreductase family protein [Actinomycetota bacterium]|nr:nitroreductase family protein [Actinomycetota bacterium]
MGSNPAIPTTTSVCFPYCQASSEQLLEFKEVVRRRRMVRNYRSTPLEEDRLRGVLEVATRAPSAGFSQGQSFVVVQDEATRAKVAQIAREPAYVARGFNPWLSRAPVHVVCCVSEKAYRDRYADADKANAVGPEGWAVPFWFVDAGCSLMLLLLAAVDEGWAAGFLGLHSDQTKEVRHLLAIPSDVTPFGIVTLGQPMPDRRSASVGRGRKAFGSVVHFERWGQGS